MTDFTVVHDTVLKAIWERFAVIEVQMAHMYSLLCNSGIHDWHYTEEGTLPSCKYCGAHTL